MTAPAWVRGALLLAVTFSAGVSVGVSYQRRSAPAHEAAGRNSHHVMQRLRHHLGLDSAQYTAIAAILARRQGTVDSTWHAMQPRVHATLDSALQEIVGVLRPDQLARHRKMLEAMHPGVLR